MNRINRRGQALVEFAVIALVLYMLLAAILTFGHLLYVAQGLQSAADLAAREISRTPLPAVSTFDDALEANDVRTRIFDEAWLVIDLATFYQENPGGSVFEILVPQMPLLNQQLVMMMIVDRPDLGAELGGQRWLLRYPGALLERKQDEAITPPPGVTYDNAVELNLTVGIPLMTRSQDGAEAIRWVSVVEEFGDAPFSIDSIQRGIVALRINYPFQSASMSSFQPNSAGPFEPTLGQPRVADDAEVATFTELNTAPGDLTGAPLEIVRIDEAGNPVRTYAGTYGGQYGLGAQGALGSEEMTGGRPVRPYRRVLSAQAIYRREIFD